MKCCVCKQPTYTPAVEIFERDQWDEPSNDLWECTRCTLHNLIGTNECNACQQANNAYIELSDDETNGNDEFLQEHSDDDDDDDGAAGANVHMMQHNQHNMNMRGMNRMGGMGGLFGMNLLSGYDTQYYLTVICTLSHTLI